MQAVVFKNKLEVAIEERPIPTIQEPSDIIVRVRYSALCGSELHVFRGHQPSPTGFIMGHEFTGEVTEVGTDVKTVVTGDYIVAPFTISCAECFYCRSSYSSRCSKSRLFGTAALDGAQAEYVRVPLADGTVVKAPPQIDKKKLVLMADIFPTGCFAADNAFQGLDEQVVKESVVVVLGCGPVGISAIISALERRPRCLLAIDSVEPRLQLAQSLGAEPWNFKTQAEALKKRIADLTDGRGADIAIEVVGHSDALALAFELLRPWGKISSVGVHNGEIPWTGNQAYGKNLQIQMGRCPVRSTFERALQLLEKKQDFLNFMVSDIRPLKDAVQAYDDFNQMKTQKVIFEMRN